MEIISNIALISINETLVFQVISFLIFLFIINRIMFRPLQRVMREREDYIHQIQTDITDSDDAYAVLTKQIKKQESAVIREAFGIRDELEKAGNQQAAEIFDSSKRDIDALRASAQKEINDQVIAARKQMQAESEALALTIMEKVLNRRLQS